MPELPEVETVVRGLQVLVGLEVKKFLLQQPSVLKRQDLSPEDLSGQHIKHVCRRGKYIIIELEKTYLVVHLGMSGRLYLDQAQAPKAKHTHALMALENDKELRYEDPRRFGGLWLVNDPFKMLASLGLEPLGPDFSKDYLQESLKKRRIPIKSLLIDQRVVAGIGNIYADEILHRAGIKPGRPANSLNEREITALFHSIRKTLQLGIENRGTTFRDYRDSLNQPGAFQHHLRVYGRRGEPCPVCGETVCREVIGGRSSHYCPGCQH